MAVYHNSKFGSHYNLQIFLYKVQDKWACTINSTLFVSDFQLNYTQKKTARKKFKERKLES
jgi:hypothetical protein